MPSRIFSMSFNVTSTLLCVSSATDTVHVFKLGVQGPASQTPPRSPDKLSSLGSHRRYSQGSEESPIETSEYLGDGETSIALGNRKPDPTILGLIRRTSQNVGTSFAATVGGYLPKGVAEIWEPARDFAWIKLPKPAQPSSTGSLRSVVAMSSNTPQVMVVTSDGNFYFFNIDLLRGGAGTLTKQYSSVTSCSSGIQPLLTALQSP